MPVSYAELKAMLDVDEPDYAALAAKAAGAMQHLRKLAASPDVALASKAVSLAGIMGEADSVAIVGNASKSRHALLRVAAAHAASLLPDSPQAARVVVKLLDDKDVGVVKIAARAATRQSDPTVVAKAQRATKRVASMARAIVAENVRRERSAAMARKASKKAQGTTRAKTTRKGSARAGQMPAGTMMAPPKGAKAADMPSGKMN